MNQLHSLTEGDITQVTSNVARIMRQADVMASQGSTSHFEIYKLARDTLEILAFDRISRDTLAKLSAGAEMFKGYPVTEVVLCDMKQGFKINAIKGFRLQTGVGLKEAKDWVEAYMNHYDLSSNSNMF